jgi:hypothetical protein
MLSAFFMLSLIGFTACSHRHAQPASAVPRGEYTTQVDGNLVRLAGNARSQGYNQIVSGPLYGRLADDASEAHEMVVVGGNDYALFAACDNDCSDLDLKIYDPAGSLVMQDVAVDDTPVLTFTAHSSGKYRIETVMATCSRNPCFYGLELMAK